MPGQNEAVSAPDPATPTQPLQLTVDGRETPLHAPVDDSHEVLHLFTPAPNQIPGQLSW
jgi:hypothetical protein